MPIQRPMCEECEEREVEVFDYSDGLHYDTRCEHCNDKRIARARESMEWLHFHSDSN